MDYPEKIVGSVERDGTDRVWTFGPAGFAPLPARSGKVLSWKTWRTDPVTGRSLAYHLLRRAGTFSLTAQSLRHRLWRELRLLPPSFVLSLSAVERWRKGVLGCTHWQPATEAREVVIREDDDA